MNDHHETYAKKPAVGRGFFAVLMLCLIAVGGVAATTFSDSLKAPEPTPAQDAVTVTTTAPATTSAKAAAVTPATTSAKATTTTTTVVTTTTTAPTEALFVLPLSNKVLTPFSEQPIFNETLNNYRAHTAVDFDGEQGQSVRPLANGTVTAVEQDLLWGGCVTVDHGAGVVSIYCGIAPTVEVGDELTPEDSLGTLGVVPCEGKLGPHLHLELYKDGKAADVTALFTDQIVYN